MKPKISAYIPCYNNADTLERAIGALQAQTVPVDEIFVVDDGSTDNSSVVAKKMGVRVIRYEENLGRGTARARAMSEAKHELVLSCDATNLLKADFVETVIPLFEEEKVGAVFGPITAFLPNTMVKRWRERHLFKYCRDKCCPSEPRNREASLATWAAVVRRSATLEVGNFNPKLRHTEDRELGDRLLAAGYDVIYEPKLLTVSIADDNLRQVLSRYWRWYAGVEERVSIIGYLRQISYSIKVMARQDIKDKDIWGVPISLLTPHYQFWRSLLRKLGVISRR